MAFYVEANACVRVDGELSVSFPVVFLLVAIHNKEYGDSILQTRLCTLKKNGENNHTVEAQEECNG